MLLLNTVAQITKIPLEKIFLTPLAGDASTRRYWRVRFADGAPYSTAILMKMSESPTLGERSFSNVGAYLQEIGVAVPQIYYEEPREQLLLLEDCSDNLLQEAIKNKSSEEISNYYFLALDEIFKMQFSKAKRLCVAFDLAFDTEKLMWELIFFKQHTLLNYLKASFSLQEEKTLTSFFLLLAQFLSEEPRYFTHRDYHSRNLMVQNGKIRVIDFQDARMGPCQYDLVSLVYDAYVTLPKKVTLSLIRSFKQEHKKREKNHFSDAQFDKALDWMLLQRSLKAAGTFGYMAVERNNRSYLQYLPRVFDLTLGVLEKYSEFNEAKKILHESYDLSGRVWDAAASFNK